MALHDTNLFPSVSAVVSDLQGGYTSNIFDNVEATVRAMGAHRFINLVRSTSQPSSPTEYLYWIRPATITNGALNPSDLQVYVNGAWVTNSPEIFAKALLHAADVETTVSAQFPIIGTGTNGDKIRISTVGLTKDSILKYSSSSQTVSWVDAQQSGNVNLV